MQFVMQFMMEFAMERKRIALGLGAGFINEAANKLIPLATLHFAATRLGVEPFGFSQFSQWLTDLGLMFVALGYSFWAPIAWRGAEKDSRASVLGTIVVTRLTLAAVVCAFLFFAVSGNSTWAEYRWIVLPSLFIVVASAFDCFWAIIALQSMPVFSAISIASKVLSLIAILFLVRGPDNALEYTLILHAANATIAIASFIYVVRRIGFIWPTLNSILMAFKQSLPFAFTAFLLIALERVDLVLVEAAFGASGAGAYGGPMKIAVSLTPVAGMVVMVFFSEMLGVFDDESMLRHLRAGLRVAVLIIAPLVVGVWFVDEAIVSIVLGPDFIQYRRVLPILCSGIAAQMLILIFGSQVLSIRGKVNLYNWSLFIGVITVIGLAWLLGSKFGLEGFALASASGRWVAAILAAGFAFSIMAGGRCRVVGEVFRSLIPVVVMAGALLMLPKFPWYLEILAGSFVYGIMTLVVYRESFLYYLKSRKSLANQ